MYTEPCRDVKMLLHTVDPMRLVSSQISLYSESSWVYVDLCVHAHSEVEARWQYSAEFGIGCGTCQRLWVPSALERVEIL